MSHAYMEIWDVPVKHKGGSEEEKRGCLTPAEVASQRGTRRESQRQPRAHNNLPDQMLLNLSLFYSVTCSLIIPVCGTRAIIHLPRLPLRDCNG